MRKQIWSLLSRIADVFTVISPAPTAAVAFLRLNSVWELAPLAAVLLAIAFQIGLAWLKQTRGAGVACGAPRRRRAVSWTVRVKQHPRPALVMLLTLMVAVMAFSFGTFFFTRESQADHERLKSELEKERHQNEKIQRNLDAAVAERDLWERLNSPPPYLITQLVQTEWQYQDGMRQAETQADRAAAVQHFLNGWSLVHSQIVTAALHSSSTIGLDVYGVSPDPHWYQWLAGSAVGFRSYDLPVNSILGCSMQYAVISGWRGINDQTQQIFATSFSGEPVGQFDSRKQLLILPQGSCQFYESTFSDLKRGLLCIGIAATEGGGGITPPGGICLKSQDSSPLDQPAVRSYLLARARALALLDLSLLRLPLAPAALPAGQFSARELRAKYSAAKKVGEAGDN
jgi:hypothetical protein